MLLGRLRVRQKLLLLVLPLLVLVVIGAVPLVTARIDAAEKSSETARVVERAVRIGELVQELQQERLATLGYLALDVGRERLVARSARVLDLAEQLAADYGDGQDDKIAALLRSVGLRSGLGGLRIQVLRQDVTGLAAYTGYTEAINGLVDALGLTSDADLSTPVGRQELALDSIIRHDEATSAAGAALFVERSPEGHPRRARPGQRRDGGRGPGGAGVQAAGRRRDGRAVRAGRGGTVPAGRERPARPAAALARRGQRRHRRAGTCCRRWRR